MAGQEGISIGGKPKGLKRHQRAHELTFPEALELGEMRLIEADLKAAILSLSTLHAQYPKGGGPPVDAPFCTALYRDAVIQFAACFDHKNGLKTDEVYAGVEGAAAYMKHLRAIRDTFIGHTFGPMRQFSVAVVPGTLRRPHQLHHALFIFSTPATATSVDQLARFIEIARRHAVEKYEAAEKAVKERLKTMTVADLRALPLAVMDAPSADELRMTRRQFRAARAGSPQPARASSKRQRP